MTTQHINISRRQRQSPSNRKVPWIAILTLVGGALGGVGTTLYTGGELLYKNAQLASDAVHSQAIAVLTTEKNKEQSRADNAETQLRQAAEQLTTALKENQRLVAGLSTQSNCNYLKKRLDGVDRDLSDLTSTTQFVLEVNTPPPEDPAKVEKVAALRKQQETLLQRVAACP